MALNRSMDVMTDSCMEETYVEKQIYGLGCIAGSFLKMYVEFLVRNTIPNQKSIILGEAPARKFWHTTKV